MSLSFTKSNLSEYVDSINHDLTKADKRGIVAEFHSYKSQVRFRVYDSQEYITNWITLNVAQSYLAGIKEGVRLSV